MRRLARTASLLVAFSLLTSAATAYAECAWVLWVQVTDTQQSEPWKPVDASSTERYCRQNMAQRIKRQADMYKREVPPPLPTKDAIPLDGTMFVIVGGDDRKTSIYALDGTDFSLHAANVTKTELEGKIESSVVVGRAPGRILSEQYRCLPDTVDPRGPKGK
jgi:hypothetical protein